MLGHFRLPNDHSVSVRSDGNEIVVEFHGPADMDPATPDTESSPTEGVATPMTMPDLSNLAEEPSPTSEEPATIGPEDTQNDDVLEVGSSGSDDEAEPPADITPDDPELDTIESESVPEVPNSNPSDSLSTEVELTSEDPDDPTVLDEDGTNQDSELSESQEKPAE